MRVRNIFILILIYFVFIAHLLLQELVKGVFILEDSLNFRLNVLSYTLFRFFNEVILIFFIVKLLLDLPIVELVYFGIKLTCSFTSSSLLQDYSVAVVQLIKLVLQVRHYLLAEDCLLLQFLTFVSED